MKKRSRNSKRLYKKKKERFLVEELKKKDHTLKKRWKKLEEFQAQIEERLNILEEMVMDHQVQIDAMKLQSDWFQHQVQENNRYIGYFEDGKRQGRFPCRANHFRIGEERVALSLE